MRSLKRNNSVFYYAKYETNTEIIDEYGNATGQYALGYSRPIQTQGNVSPNMGEMQSQLFGESEMYDKVIVLDNRNIDIDEYSILWVDTPPSLNEDGSTDTPHDFIVKKVARSLNSVSIAISKVTVK